MTSPAACLVGGPWCEFPTRSALILTFTMTTKEDEQAEVGDPLRALKLIEYPATDSGVRNRSRDRACLREIDRANHCLVALRCLASGYVSEEVLETRPSVKKGLSPHHLTGKSLAAGMAMRVLKAVRRRTPASDRPVGRVAFERLTGGAASACGPYPAGSVPATPATLAKRGDICPAVVDEISLPPAGTRGLKITEISPRAAALLQDYKTTMLQERAPEEGVTDIKPYTDPNLRVKKNMIKLVARMAASGMMSTSDVCKGEVALFTVVKTWVTSETGPPKRSSRLVFDERLENLKWREPPWCSLGAGTALGFIDASKEIAEGCKVMSAVGDIPDYYYRLLLPEEVGEHHRGAGRRPDGRGEGAEGPRSRGTLRRDEAVHDRAGPGDGVSVGGLPRADMPRTVCREQVDGYGTAIDWPTDFQTSGPCCRRTWGSRGWSRRA